MLPASGRLVNAQLHVFIALIPLTSLARLLTAPPPVLFHVLPPSVPLLAALRWCIYAVLPLLSFVRSFRVLLSMTMSRSLSRV